MGNRKKIVVAMSGGVDSSTVAALLHSEGYEVIGITLQLYDHGEAISKKGACCAGQDIYDAQIAAEKIGIPHYVLNYESIFKQKVIDDFAESYMRGETPIPCVMCNQKVKFEDLLKASKDLGADALATGHYVQKIQKENNISELHKAHDSTKDQSYFLFSLTKSQLDYLLFPLGGLKKSDTRNLAKQFELDIAEKPESQDICFVPDGNYAKIIQKLRPEALQPGEIVSTEGKILGKHNGIINYTIGQRRGIGISNTEPLYVIKLDPNTNRVIVGKKSELKSSTFTIKELNWLCSDSLLNKEFNCFAKLRSTHSGAQASVKYIGKGKAEIKLNSDHNAVTPGQACVLYDGSKVLGGGWIMRSL